ncbi:MAG: caspase family protein [Gammaproteobacteria bacterium]|nr:caspase family protein [Gammaproteobacteria bacterium]
MRKLLNLYLTATITIVASILTPFSVCASDVFADPSAKSDTDTKNVKRGLARNSTTDTIVAGRFRALIIGNNEYQDKEQVWGKLYTAIPGAIELANVLKNDYGFSDVRVVKNAAYREIIQALTDLIETSRFGDNVLIYFAGHGYKNEKTGEAYWVPVDAEGWDDSLFVSNARIKEKVAALSDITQHVLLISDSCFSGTLTRSAGSEKTGRSYSTRYIEKLNRRKSVYVLAAGGDEYVDDSYRNSGHSPFTYFLLQELKDNSKRYFPISELSSDVRVRVGDAVKQTPQRGVLQGARHEGGEFVFVKFAINIAIDGEKIEVEITQPQRNTEELDEVHKPLYTPLVSM